MSARHTPTITFSVLNDPARWDTDSASGVIACLSADDAKRAEALFNRLETDRAALLEALAEFIRIYDESELRARDGGELVSAIHDARAAIRKAMVPR